MNPALTPDIQEVMGAVHYRPAVSLIMPFEPKIGLKAELSYALKVAVDKTEEEILDNYPNEKGRIVIEKLKNIVKQLNFSSNKKSIAIYVSPVFEKVVYLDIPVEEKIIIDESFEIRDLVYSKKQVHKYLVVQLSGKESKVFLGNTESFLRLATHTPESAYAYINDAPEKVANFSDPSERREIILDKFLMGVDKGLGTILNSYPLPVFIMGAERTMGHFRKITRHENSIVAFIQGNYEDANSSQLAATLKPYVSEWQNSCQKDLLAQLEEAASQKKMVSGIKEVWKEAMNRKGRLLLVEKNYMVAAQRGSHESSIHTSGKSSNSFSDIKDAVDDVIEKVLENGGDVEFVENGLLADQHRIALILYY